MRWAASSVSPAAREAAVRGRVRHELEGAVRVREDRKTASEDHVFDPQRLRHRWDEPYDVESGRRARRPS